MNPDLIVSIISSFIAVLSLTGTFIIYRITRHRENTQNLMEQIRYYSNPEMGIATQRLWDHYRTYMSSNFPAEYINIKKAEDNQMASMPSGERSDFLIYTLHHHRRILSHFWRGLSVLIRNDLVPKKLVYSWFYKDAIDIVDEVLIPIENEIAKEYGLALLNPKTDPLYYLSNIKGKFNK